MLRFWIDDFLIALDTWTSLSIKFEISRRKSPTVGTCHDWSELESWSEVEDNDFGLVGGLSGSRRVTPGSISDVIAAVSSVYVHREMLTTSPSSIVRNSFLVTEFSLKR